MYVMSSKKKKNIIEDGLKFCFRKILKDDIQCWKYFHSYTL